MSKHNIPPANTEIGNSFPSLESMRIAHAKLLKEYRESDNSSSPELITKIEEFICKGRSTGTLLDLEEERWTGQSLLDYWGSILYRTANISPDANLTDFDATISIELHDSSCPYPGLVPFEEKDCKFFFGQQQLVEKIAKQLQNNQFLSIIGDSGTGKSSVVMSGVLPALKTGVIPGSQNWRYYPRMMPGANPIASLLQLIYPEIQNNPELFHSQLQDFQNDPNCLSKLIGQENELPALIFIDQFEETFTLCHDSQTQQAFIENLINLVHKNSDRHTVILAVRTDCESQIIQIEPLKSVFEQSRVTMNALDSQKLRASIEKPAELVGLKYEEGIVDEILRDILSEPIALPLLQFILRKLWDGRERNRITWEFYKNLGTSRSALSKTADTLFEQLGPDEQSIAKNILMRLVDPIKDARFEIKQVQRKELYQLYETREPIDWVLYKFSSTGVIRLIKHDFSDYDRIELAHESLIYSWPLFSQWIEEEKTTKHQRARLTSSAQNWLDLDRTPDALLRGELLADAITYQDLNSLETEFIHISLQYQNQERKRLNSLLDSSTQQLVKSGEYLLDRTNENNKDTSNLDHAIEQYENSLKLIKKTNERRISPENFMEVFIARQIVQKQLGQTGNPSRSIIKYITQLDETFRNNVNTANQNFNSTIDIDAVIAQYKDVLNALEYTLSSTDIKLQSERIIEVLILRDLIQSVLDTQTPFRNINSLKDIKMLDKYLVDLAKKISNLDCLVEWRSIIHPDEKTWWWFLDLKTLRPKKKFDWIFNALYFSSIGLSFSLFLDISYRFLVGGLDVIGIFPVIIYGILLLVLIYLGLTRGGQEDLKNILIGRRISPGLLSEAKFALSIFTLISLLSLDASLPRISTLYYERGLAARYSNQFSTAKSSFKRAIQLYPDYAEAHFRLGSLYEDLQDLDLALTHYRIAAVNGLPEAFNNLGRLYILEQDYNSALPLLYQGLFLLDAHADNVDLRYVLLKNLGWAALGQKRLDEAKETLEEAIALRDEEASAYCLLAQVLEAQNKNALEVWGNCLNYARPTNPDEGAWLGLAQARLEQESKE